MLVNSVEISYIEDVEITIADDGSSIQVICVFLPMSDSEGCAIHIQCQSEEYSNPHSIDIYTLKKNVTTSTTDQRLVMCDPACLTYCFIAYDILQNGSVANTSTITIENVTCDFNPVTDIVPSTSKSFLITSAYF